ncbi:hypothetical protein C8Q79DRAFT_1012806 [Trametes meyenii]|nr:hypothetical protein C8Q79DRAFT_1012806 [Trametes meyenii]
MAHFRVFFPLGIALIQLYSAFFYAYGVVAAVVVLPPSSPPTVIDNVVYSDFLGISIEHSFVSYYFGNSTDQTPPAVIKYLSALNSAYVPDQTEIIQVTDPNANSNDRPVNYGPQLFEVMKSVSSAVNGAHLRTPNNSDIPRLTGDAPKALGDDLDAFLLGSVVIFLLYPQTISSSHNKNPDLYTDHGNRPGINNYTQYDYIGDYWTVFGNLQNTSDGDVLSQNKIAGPTIYCNWEGLATVLQTGWLKDFAPRLKYICVAEGCHTVAGAPGDWTTNPSFYGMLPVAEALHSANGSRVVDLNVGNSSSYAKATVAGYVIYDGSFPNVHSLVLINFANASGTTMDYAVNASFVQALADDSAVSIRYLSAPSLNEKTDIAWSGKTYAGGGDAVPVNADFSTSMPDKNMSCAGGCTVQVPGPGLAVVFLGEAPNFSITPARNGTGPGTSSSDALKFVSPDVNPPIPWQRVLAASGVISSRGPGTNGAARQRDALIAEGVEVDTTRAGEFKVDLRTYGWFPAVGTIDTGVQIEEDEAAEEPEQGG